MGLAAFGFVPPIFGAALQEAIDVGVILNALRASLTGEQRVVLWAQRPCGVSAQQRMIAATTLRAVRFGCSTFLRDDGT